MPTSGFRKNPAHLPYELEAGLTALTSKKNVQRMISVLHELFFGTSIGNRWGIVNRLANLPDIHYTFL